MKPSNLIRTYVETYKHQPLMLAALCEQLLTIADVVKDLEQALCELSDTIPNCMGDWLEGSGGHAVFSADCRNNVQYYDEPWWFCEHHVPRHLKKKSAMRFDFDEMIQILNTIDKKVNSI